MSLFKARDFWSFDLNRLAKLEEQGGGNFDREEDEELIEGGEFVADLGRFQAIGGGRHDVLVCANLRGMIFIVQVPENVQKRFDGASRDNDNDNNIANEATQGERQLLLVKKLDKDSGLIVSDLKCGHFSSTTKQSIAVLTSRTLMVFRVKQQEQSIDLVSGEPNAAASFSHILEEQYRIDLIDGEFAQAIVVVNRQAGFAAQQQVADKSLDGGPKNQLCLPQRDSIVVQYSNQLLVSLLDYKKVVGHYRLRLDTADDRDQSMWKLAQSTGCMPAAFLHETQSLVVSLTNRNLCSLPLSKLSAQAKEIVVKRVARNLLASALTYNNTAETSELIELDLSSVCGWQREILNLPLQMTGISRLSETSKSQFLVMSRYNLDLFSSQGDHLWSQRFETGLICQQIYLLPAAQDNKRPADQLFIIICSDCLSSDKCNLSIMREDQIVWSALLNSKPFQVWRANLQKMSGLLVSLDAIRGLLSVSYLGTNKDQLEGEEDDALQNDSNDYLGQFETLDESLVAEGREKKQTSAASLSVQVRLEASNQWPDVCIDCRLSVSPAQTASVGGLLQNIVLLMNFDEALRFEWQRKPNQTMQEVDNSTVQLNLGNCWPDRPEPLFVEGKFRLRSSNDLMRDESVQLSAATGERMATQARSLKIELVFKFNEIHSDTRLQEECFLLPLSLVSQLTLIDYSAGGTDATLEDVLVNLGPTYKRPAAGLSRQPNAAAFKSCDILVQSRADLLELADELIEADLICRGLQRGHERAVKDDSASASEKQSRRMSTLENISLLAQSLDCRLRFKSLARPASFSSNRRDTFESSEEAISSGQQEVTLISFGLRLATSRLDFMSSTANDDLHDSETSLVWLHLLDLEALTSSSPLLVEQFVREHLSDWRWQKLVPSKSRSTTSDNDATLEGNHPTHPILVSIESEEGQAILFVQNHFIERIQRSSTMILRNGIGFNSLHELQHDSIEVNLKNLLTMEPFLAYNVSMHNYLRDLLKAHRVEVEDKFKLVKAQLATEFRKFQVTTAASLSLARKLCDLPDEMLDQFNALSKVTSQIQLNLTGLLAQMEKLKKLDRMFSKTPIVPESCRIVVELAGENCEEQLVPSRFPLAII